MVVKLNWPNMGQTKGTTQPKNIGQLVRGMAILSCQAATSCGVTIYGSNSWTFILGVLWLFFAKKSSHK
jgi:hypothetical protein